VSGTAQLLILSQVILSLQLPFAVVPLVQFTSDRTKMGNLVNPGWLKWLAWVVAALIIALNVKLLLDVAASLVA
jgi:manganese transport protein